jgi:hypothetical protein
MSIVLEESSEKPPFPLLVRNFEAFQKPLGIELTKEY